MKTLLIASAVMMAGTAALSQSAPPAPPPSAPMADKVMTRAEVVAMVREHFGKLDSDHDGAITTAEVTKGKENWAEHRGPGGGMHDGAMGDPKAAFDRLDSNKDGAISQDEFAKGREQRVEKRIVMREGRKDGDRGAMRMHRMGGMSGRMIVMADTNKDGRITLPEAEALALQHFDQMDSNRDGQVTSEERRAAWQTMKKQMHAPDAG
jgi:Ca2+-binding EF-hand superfamily protein